MEPSGFFHFNILNAVLLIFSGVAAYKAYVSKQTKLQGDSDRFGKWMETHQLECDERDRKTAELLGELKTINSHLVTVSEGQDHRIQRLERESDDRRGARSNSR